MPVVVTPPYMASRQVIRDTSQRANGFHCAPTVIYLNIRFGSFCVIVTENIAKAFIIEV